jgi:hypothetical protein
MDDRQKIAAFLETHELSKGLGSESSPCSIAAINLALTGRLTDEIPDCMSEVIGRWIIGVQDAMTDDLRNSVRWKALLPTAAGTGRAHEPERSALILTWMFEKVLSQLQGLADEKGFGNEWRNMLTLRTPGAARAAEHAAFAAAAFAAAFAAEAVEFWQRADPCGLLEQLSAVTGAGGKE